ncbi:MAG TPA: tetratricopeptide repeat protein [Kofleriaceae bacterium]
MRGDPTGARATPLDPSYALLALEDADDREQIFEVLLRAVRSHMRFAALLSVHADELRGRRALADEPVDRARIDSWRIPRNTVALFETAIGSRTASVGRAASGEPFVDGLLEQLGATSPTMLMLPIAIGTRTVALVVGHRERESFALADVADVLPIAEAASPALARVLSARAKTAAPRPDTGYEIEVIVPDAAKRRARVDELRAGERWEELTDVIRELVADGVERGDPDEDEQLELLLELGRVEADELHRVDRAIDAWRGAQTIDAGDPRVHGALHALFVQQGAWTECADLLEKRIALADDPAARVPLLLELATIAHERLDDDERAIAAFERVLNWEPAHELALRELEHLYSARQQWQALAALLLDRASREADAAQALSSLEAVAQMYEDKLGDARSAFLVWLAVFRRDPDRDDALDQLQRLAAAVQDPAEIIAEGSALAEELDAAHPATAARVWHLVGGWSRDLAANRDDAAHALESAHRADPANADVLADLTALLRDDARWGELVAVWTERASVETDLQRRGELFAALGEIYDHELGEPAEAIVYYEKARADEPEHAAALAALHRLYRQTGAWASLAELLLQLIGAPDLPRAHEVELRVELGGVLADQLGRIDDAIHTYTAALAIAPEHSVAFKQLEALYRRTGQADALLDAREAQADAAEPDVQRERYPELAEAWHARGRNDRAIACWQKLVAIEALPEAVRTIDSSRIAHRGLADALRAGEQWGSYVVELRALLELIAEPAARLPILIELGDVLATQLDDVDGGLAAYQAALAIDPDRGETLDALARLYERSGQAASALAVLQRLLDRTPQPRARAALFQRMGNARFDANDVTAARGDFAQALALDLDNAATHEGLARVHLQHGELVAGGEELIRAAELAPATADKIRCLADAAWVFRHRLHDPERARQCLHLVLELEPDHADAKLALAGLLSDTKQWESLWPHLEQEVARANADATIAATERADIYARAARCALELDKLGVALELYEQAATLDPSPALQIARAEAQVRSKALGLAASSFQSILLRHQAALDRDQLINVYRRLAEIHTALAKPSQAQLFHQKVLELEPAHRATLKDLADLHVARGRFDEAIANLRTYGELVDGPERSVILERIGDLYRDKLGNSARASSTYFEALEHDAGNRRVLQRLLDLQSAAGQWKLAVDTIGKFLDRETDPSRRAAYHLAGAEIRRNELKDRAGALDAYDAAIDELFREEPLSPATRMRGFDTFRIVDEMITADRNWKYQEQAYRRMIKRVPKDDPALIPLWDALGEVYRTRLKHYQSALETLELAHSLDPNKSPQRAAILAELYALLGKRAPQQAAKLAELDPTSPEAYRAIMRASLPAGRIDEAWCAARALVFLKQATADETALYKQHRAREARKATGYFDEASWSFVAHRDEDRTISAIFTLIWQGPVATRSGPAKAFDLKPKERLPVEDGTRTIAKLFRHAARVLGVALPDVYVQPERSGRLLLANCVDRGRLVPTVIVGRDLMTGYRDTELAASIGALLAQLRPAYYLKLALPNVDELEAALAAAAQLGGRELGRAKLAPLRDSFAAEIAQRIGTRGDSLAALVARLPEVLDVARWRNAVDATAQRAGLLVSGDLAAAARMLSTEPGAHGSHRVRELVAYSVSPEYFAARRHLGVAVG